MLFACGSRDEVISAVWKGRDWMPAVHYPIPVSSSTGRMRAWVISVARSSLGADCARVPLFADVFPELTERQIDFVIETVTETIGAGAIA